MLGLRDRIGRALNPVCTGAIPHHWRPLPFVQELAIDQALSPDDVVDFPSLSGIKVSSGDSLRQDPESSYKRPFYLDRRSHFAPEAEFGSTRTPVILFRHEFGKYQLVSTRRHECARHMHPEAVRSPDSKLFCESFEQPSNRDIQMGLATCSYPIAVDLREYKAGFLTLSGPILFPEFPHRHMPSWASRQPR